MEDKRSLKGEQSVLPLEARVCTGSETWKYIERK